MPDLSEVAEALKSFEAPAPTEDVQPPAPDAEGQGDEETDEQEVSADDDAEVSVDTEVDEDEDTEDDDTVEVDGEVPTEYMGHDLTDIEDAETRRLVIEKLKSSDKHINKVQQEKSELEKRLADIEEQLESGGEKPPVEDAAPEMPSDEQLAEALGYDKEDPLYEVKVEAALPVAKEVLRLGGMVEGLMEQFAAQTFITEFHSKVDSLEDSSQPIDRDAFVDFMLEKELDDISAAFTQFTAPSKEEAARQSALDIAKKEATEELKKRKKQASTRRPSGTETDSVVPATREEAILAAAKELKIQL